MILFSILWNDILPLFVFIGAGWFLDSKLKLDISTYSKLTILVVLPCFIFYSLYGYRGSSMEMAAVAAAVLLLLVQFLLSGGLGRLLHLQKGKFDEFRAVSTFSNSGHIGAALIMLIYSHPPFAEGNSHPYLAEALGTMAVLMIVMNMAVNVFGAALIRSRGASVSEFFRYLLKMPALYAALLAVLVRAADIPLEHTFLWPVLQHFNGAFIVLITVTIGIELHRSRLQKPGAAQLASGLMKLIAAPFLAWWILLLFSSFMDMSPVMKQVFFLYAAIPSSMALIIYSVEYDNHPDFVTQSVLFNTVVGAFTVTAAIYLSRVLFPLGL